MSIAELESAELGLESTGGLWREAWQRLRRNPGAIVGAFFVMSFVVIALFAPVIAPFKPDYFPSTLPSSCCPGPSAQHLLGVDVVGRDTLSRVMYGARFSLTVGVVSVAVGLSIGMVLGAIAGYLGGIVDSVIMRLMDVMLSIPGLRPAILFSHILPNSISPVIVQGTLALATAIIDVAGLGFLGLGPQDPSTAEWGTMLADAQDYLAAQPLLAIFPGIVISVLGFNLIGDGLREALDPKLRGRA